LAIFLIITALFCLNVNSKHLENSSLSILAASSARYKDFCRLEPTCSRKYCFAKARYYSNSNASFQLQRLIRSGDTAVSLNPGPNTLRCFLQNARSLKAVVRDECSTESKIGLFKDIVYGQDLDVICITETWLNDTVYDHELLPSGYTIFRNDRKGRVGSRVLIATKLNLPTREIDHSVDLLECVAVEIDLNNHQTVLFINCYRPPTDKDFVIKLKSLLNIIQINKYWGTFIMVGDFNYPGIHWINALALQVQSLVQSLYIYFN
jgi:hypothetical protein